MKPFNYKPKNRNTNPVESMAIGAHQDDLEIIATPAIARCEAGGPSMVGVVVTDGGGSARSGPYKDFSDEAMKARRIEEQKEAAEMGRYHAMVFLNQPSHAVKDTSNQSITDLLAKVIMEYQPKILYTHQPFDKHKTHVKLLKHVIEALKKIPDAMRPQSVYGVEVWRDLDWLPDHLKVTFDVTNAQTLTARLLQCFDSQIAGGKRYDLAVEGRRRAHATFYESHAVDVATQMLYALDLTVFTSKEPPSLNDYMQSILDAFKQEVFNLMDT